MRFFAAIFRFKIFIFAALGFIINSSPAANGAEQLELDRINQIAGWLPEQPSAFAWSITNRGAWEKLAAENPFKTAVKPVEKFLHGPLPSVPDDLYLEYSRNGNRTRWQAAEFERRGRIGKLTLAEAVENRGQFLPALEKVIAAVCAERTWVYPAHDGDLKNFHGEVITPELGATGLAAELAEADFILGDHLTQATRKLIRDNVRRRVLEPFRAMIEGRRKEAFWLRTEMNWNAVCVGNTVFAALALEPSRADRAFYVAAGEHCIQFYLKGFTLDGYCAEGVGYWNYGFGHFILLTEAVRRATAGHIDFMTETRAAEPARFCLHSEIINGIYPTISDCSPGAKPDPQLVNYVCRRFGLASLESIRPAFNERLAITMMLASLNDERPAVIMAPESGNFSAERSFFPGGGVLLARTKANVQPGFAVELKGGNNNEPHNHNDVGSFSVILGTNMVICDPGGEVYTRRTFGSHRYDSKVLNSFGHAVPVVAGKLQRSGAAARGIILATNFAMAADTITMDIRSAYPVPDLEKLERTFVFERGPAPSLEMRDAVQFSSPETFESALVTWGKIKMLGDNLVEISDGGRTVRVKIDTQGRRFTLRQEPIDEDVMSKRKPIRLGIGLDERTSSAVVSLRIVPVD